MSSWRVGGPVSDPRIRARINRANRFSHGLVAALPLNGLPYEAATDAAIVYEGAPFFAASPSGEGLFTDGTDDGLMIMLPRTLNIPVTLLCMYCVASDSDVFNNTAQRDVPVTLRDEASAYETFSLAFNNTAGSVAVFSAGMLDDTSGSGVGVETATNYFSSGAAGIDLVLTGVFPTTTSAAIYVNGELGGSGAVSARDPNVTRLYVGHGSSSSAHDAFARGITKCVLVWDRALSAAEVMQISQNPWQVFETPYSARLPFKPIVAAPANVAGSLAAKQRLKSLVNAGLVQ